MTNRMRNTPFSFRLWHADFNLLDAKKDNWQLSKSEYIRYIILFASTCERSAFDHETAMALQAELNACGQTINAITHKVNLFHAIDEEDLAALTACYISLFGIYENFMWCHYGVQI